MLFAGQASPVLKWCVAIATGAMAICIYGRKEVMNGLGDEDFCSYMKVRSETHTHERRDRDTHTETHIHVRRERETHTHINRERHRKRGRHRERERERS